MSDIFFILKSFLITIVFITILQVKIGESKLEDHALSWVHNSSLTQPLQEVAEGGAKFLTDTWKKLRRKIDKDVFKTSQLKDLPGNREINFQLKRSQKFINENVQKAAQKMNDWTHEQDQSSPEHNNTNDW